MRHHPAGFGLRYGHFILEFSSPLTSLSLMQNHRSIQKVVALLIPGLTPETLSLPPLPTSATANPNLPLEIPLPGPDSTNSNVPFIASKFSHACPTHAPGEQMRMHSVLGAFFQSPVSGEEKKRRIAERVACEFTNRSIAFQFSPLLH